MQLDINCRGFTLSPSLRDYLHKRLACHLGHTGGPLRRVTVRLSDINGPRGGEDKRCHLQLHLDRLPPIVIEDTQADLYVAIDRAAERAGRTMQRRLARHLRDAPGVVALEA